MISVFNRRTLPPGPRPGLAELHAARLRRRACPRCHCWMRRWANHGERRRHCRHRLIYCHRHRHLLFKIMSERVSDINSCVESTYQAHWQ